MMKQLSLSILLLTTYAHSMDRTQDLYRAIERSDFDTVHSLINKPETINCDHTEITNICSETMKKRTQGLPYNSFGPLLSLFGAITFSVGFYNESRRAYGNYQKDADTEFLFGLCHAYLMGIGTLLVSWGVKNHPTKQAYKDAAAIKQLLITRGIIDAHETVENNDTAENEV